MSNLAQLTQTVDAIAVVVATIPALLQNVRDDYQNLKARIEALIAQLDDPNVQVEIDALSAKLTASLATLQTGLGNLSALDESVPPIPPPQPPAG